MNYYALLGFAAVAIGSALISARFCRNGWGPREPDQMPLEPGHQLFPLGLPEMTSTECEQQRRSYPTHEEVSSVAVALATHSDDTQPTPALPKDEK